jgi:hypothetical protein
MFWCCLLVGTTQVAGRVLVKVEGLHQKHSCHQCVSC